MRELYARAGRWDGGLAIAGLSLDIGIRGLQVEAQSRVVKLFRGGAKAGDRCMMVQALTVPRATRGQAQHIARRHEPIWHFGG